MKNKKLIFKSTLSILFLTAAQFFYVNCSSRGFQAQLLSTTGGASGASSSASSGSGGAGVVATPTPLPAIPQGKVEVLMAAGHMGRTVMSCDDGQTWINDISANSAARCWVTGDPNYVECDHTIYSGTGLDYGQGWFFVQNGWGYDGGVRRSKDGLNWEMVRPAGWGGGVVANSKIVLSLFERLWATSADGGSLWQDVTVIDRYQYDHAFLKRSGEKLFAVGRAAGKVAMSFTTDGKTWTTPAGFQADWGGSFAEGNGILLAMSGTSTPDGGYAVRSLDGGVTWSAVHLFSTAGQTWSSNVIFNGTHFVNWSKGERWRSTDGVTWERTAIKAGSQDPNLFIGPTAYNPRTGTYVAVLGYWGSNYDQQKAFRSKDGVNWTQLDSAHFQGGHPLMRITLGEMDASACH